jgi:hypothetical protein
MRVSVFNVGSEGLITDIEPHLLAPEAWSGVRNIRFSKRGAERVPPDVQVFGALSVVPQFLLNAPSATQSFWIYSSLTKAYVYDGAVHTNITRQTASVDVDYTVSEGYRWNGTIFGGIPLINNGVDVPQFWSALNPATKLANLTNWPASLRCKRLISFGPYLIALNLTEAGINKPHMIQWSHKADPGTIPTSWDYTSTIVDAGRLELTDIHGGIIQDAQLLGNKLIVYKAGSTHALRFVGGNSIFSPELLLATAGLLAPKCAVPFKLGTKHFAVTVDDIIVHSGERSAESIVDDRMRKAIFREIDPVNYLTSFCFDNTAAKEVWFCYPTIGALYPTQAAVWDYKNDTWSIREFKARAADVGAITESAGTTWDVDTVGWDAHSNAWANTSLEKIVYVDTLANKAFKIDSGDYTGVSLPTGYLERTGFAFDSKDRTGALKANFDTRKLVNRLWLKMSGIGLVNVKLGSQEDLRAGVVWSNQQSFNPVLDRYLDFTTNGRLIAIRIESADNNFWSLQGYDLELVVNSNL